MNYSQNDHYDDDELFWIGWDGFQDQQKQEGGGVYFHLELGISDVEQAADDDNYEAEDEHHDGDEHL